MEQFNITERRIFAFLFDLCTLLTYQIMVYGLLKHYAIYADYLYKDVAFNVYVTGMRIEFVLTAMYVLFYFVVIPFFNDGSTIGKQLLKIKVVNSKMQKPSIVQTIIRNGFLFGIILQGVVVIKYVHILYEASQLVLLEDNIFDITQYKYYFFTNIVYINGALCLIIFCITNGKATHFDYLAKTKVIISESFHVVREKKIYKLRSNNKVTKSNEVVFLQDVQL